MGSSLIRHVISKRSLQSVLSRSSLVAKRFGMAAPFWLAYAAGSHFSTCLCGARQGLASQGQQGSGAAAERVAEAAVVVDARV